jgi:GAF domain-containing protein
VSVDDRLEQLRSALAVARVTLRLDVSGLNFPVIGEALAHGTRSIRHDDTVDQRGAATAQWVMRHRNTLVQPDVLDTDPPPPQALVELYGVAAQILSPVMRDGSVVGWVSVHASSPREWSAHDVDLVDATAHDLARSAEKLTASFRR